jgi:myo-inositol-1(or 4)-monophosphatase
MYNSDITVVKAAIKNMESKVFRDFIELENLQSSNAIVSFSQKTLEKMRSQLFDFFTYKRKEYSLIIKDGESRVADGAKRTIFVNCLTGLKNFTHSIPYFATAIAIRENGKYYCAIVNNYATQEMFVASDEGAFLNGKRMRVSNKNDPISVMVGIKYDKSKRRFGELLERLNMSFKVNNCCILDMCCAAAGKLDGGIIFEAAVEELEIGELFVTKAGGIFEFLNGEKTDCVYSNSIIHSGLKKCLG